MPGKPPKVGDLNKFFGVLFAAVILCFLAFWGFVTYVAAHFIMKFW